MPRNPLDRAAKAAFVASLIVFAFLYGFVARETRSFPNDFVVESWRQLSTVVLAAWNDEHPAAQPRAHRRRGARVLDSAAVSPGLTLVPSIWEEFDWKPGLKLIDVDGRVMHEWTVDPAVIFPSAFFTPLSRLMRFNQPHGTHLFPDGDVLVNVARIGTARLDACSGVEWRITANHHHSVEGGADGTFWVSGQTRQRGEDPLLGNPHPIRHDLLVHISEDGEVLDEIPVFDILRQNEELLRRHFRFRPEDTHLNDIEPLPSSMETEYPLFAGGDLLVSLKHLNLIFVLDPETLEVKWWVGRPFIQQHDPDFVGDGWIGVFDNNEDGTDRGTRFGGSRVVAFQPHSDSTAVWYQSPDPGGVYSHNRGNWQLLENGNFLLTESNAGRLVEVSPEGRLVWEWIQPPYDQERVPSIYWAERYPFSRERVSAWPCSSVPAPADEEGSE